MNDDERERRLDTMTESSWIRARSSEQIEQRVSAILDAAATVFHTTPYDNVTMRMIAEEAGFTRSNLYRYFNTREEIFLTLFLSDAGAWAAEISSAFTEEMPLEAFADAWTEILCRQARLLELSPLLTLSLEKNTSEEIFRKTKLTLYGLIADVVAVLRKAVPSLSDEQWYDFFTTHQALLAGGWPMAQHTEMQERVLGELGLCRMTIDFRRFYRETMLRYLRGMIQQ